MLAYYSVFCVKFKGCVSCQHPVHVHAIYVSIFMYHLKIYRSIYIYIYMCVIYRSQVILIDLLVSYLVSQSISHLVSV